jgi:thiamine-phosphate pyrophosphorylase
MADLFLIAPPSTRAATIAGTLERVLAAASPKVLLIPRNGRSESDYKALVKAAAPVAQRRDVAVLVEGEARDVRMLGADGLHVTGGLADIADAIEALKPDFIVGAAGFETRHEAMEAGELDIDYVFFGPLSGPIEPAARDLAQWWAETMTVPSVLSDPEADPATADAAGCEFIAAGARLWEPPL